MLPLKLKGVLYIIGLTKFIRTIGLLLFFSPLLSYAANNGTFDGGKHQFAGYLGTPSQSEAANTGCNSDVIYFSCGGYLVDVESIGLPPSLDRRIFLTAGHCVAPRDNADKPFFVHFTDWDARVVNSDPACGRVVGFNENLGITYYKSKKSWTFFTTKSSGIGVGSGKVDYAIILLDNRVSEPDVAVPAKVALTNPANTLTASNIPMLGMAGFGLAGFGNLNQKNALGQPLAIIGPREKMYVEMPTQSVQNWNILSQMNAAQSQQTACNGDSGSALFVDTNGVYSVYGHVANGDYNCRATNTSTRVDTQEFRDFVKSVSPEIIQAATPTP